MAKDYHNKGQEDRSEGNYEPPHGVLKDFFTWSPQGCKTIAEENGSYNAGWGHTEKQVR